MPTRRALARLPHGRARNMLDAVGPHLRVDAFRRAAQRELAQRKQVALAEEVLDARARPARASRPCPRCSRCSRSSGVKVDQHDLVGLVEHAVGQRLAHLDAGDAADDVVQALEVLDVDGRVDVDAGGEQLVARPDSASGWREPGALVCASSSTSSNAGLRASAASRSNSSSEWPRYSTLLARQDLEPREQPRRLAAGRASRRRRRRRRGPARAAAAPRPASRRSCRRRATRRRRSSAGRARRALRPRSICASSASGSGRSSPRSVIRRF